MIPPWILEAVHFVAHYASDAVEWLDVKVELLDQLPVEWRSYFSRRHEITKKHTTNEMERAIVKEWKLLTDVDLVMPETDRSLPRVSRNGRLAFYFLVKRYPRGMKEVLRNSDDDDDKKAPDAPSRVRVPPDGG